jgi:hypothetical protein
LRGKSRWGRGSPPRARMSPAERSTGAAEANGTREQENVGAPRGNGGSVGRWPRVQQTGWRVPRHKHCSSGCHGMFKTRLTCGNMVCPRPPRLSWRVRRNVCNVLQVSPTGRRTPAGNGRVAVPGLEPTSQDRGTLCSPELVGPNSAGGLQFLPVLRTEANLIGRKNLVSLRNCPGQGSDRKDCGSDGVRRLFENSTVCLIVNAN